MRASPTIGCYSTNLPVLGGGERYFLTILDQATRVPGAEVVLMTPEPPFLQDWKRLGVHVAPDSVRWIRTPDRSFIAGTKNLDLFFAMRGVPPYTRARRSIAVIQFPHRDFWAKRGAGPRGLARDTRIRLDRRILSRYEVLLCYSQYVKEYIAMHLGRSDARVLYPPVDPAVSVGPKEPIILAVARFVPHKRQDALLEAFRMLLRRLPSDQHWELHLAGGVSSVERHAREVDGFIAKLRRAAESLPVSFHFDISRAELLNLYRRSTLFWHAAGYGLTASPALVEHFGITTVEAMNHSCVPLVVALGGQREIVRDGRTGVLWHDLDELVERTCDLITVPAKRQELAERAARVGAAFSTERFREQVDSILFR